MGYVQAYYDVWYYLFDVFCYLAALRLKSCGTTIQEYGLLDTHECTTENRSQNVCLRKLRVSPAHPPPFNPHQYARFDCAYVPVPGYPFAVLSLLFSNQQLAPGWFW